MDIDFALEEGYRRHPSAQKLLLRKVDSLISLGRIVEAKAFLDGAPELANLPAECSQLIRLESMIKPDSEQTEQTEPLKVSPINNKLNSITATLVTADQYEPNPNLTSLSAKLELQYDPVKKGRYLVAKTDVQPGDILAVELPFSSVLLKPYELTYCHHCCRRLESIGPEPSPDCGTKKNNVMKCKGEWKKFLFTDIFLSIVPFRKSCNDTWLKAL